MNWDKLNYRLDSYYTRVAALKPIARFVKEHPDEELLVLPMTRTEMAGLRAFLFNTHPAPRSTFGNLLERLEDM